MDTFIIAHGSPMISIDEKIPAHHFLKSWVPAGLAGPQPPRAILVVSGHWETDTPAVSAIHGTNDTIYDFDGIPFPDQMYKLTYPAPGAPDVAKRTKQLLADAGFGAGGRGPPPRARPRRVDPADAHVPGGQRPRVPALGADGTGHDLGRALAPLREDDGVLVVGSGNATHNLRRILRTFAPTSHEPAPRWAAEFDAWLKESLLGGRHEDVKRYLEKAPHAEVAHPRPDHLYLIHHSWSNATLSYASYRFATRN